MPQGDDYLSSSPNAPAPEPVVEPTAAPAPDAGGTPPAAAPGVDETPASADTPAEAQRKQDRAFAAQRRRIEAQAVEIAALKARVDAAAHPPAAQTTLPAPDAPSARPDPNAYASHEEWVEAVADWKADQKILAREQANEARARQTAAQTEQETVQTAWQKQETAARASYADYDEALDADATRYHPAILANIQASEVGAQLAYHLATHPEEAQRLAALPPGAGLRALGKLEARFEASPAPEASPPPHPTPAPHPRPRPLTPVGGAGGASSTRPPEEMDYEEYSAWYKKTYDSR